MYLISKEFHFSAAHRLHGLYEGHACGNDHGHNYTVRIELESPTLNDTGFVMDFGELQPLKTYIKKNFDHRDLNTVPVLEGVQTSSENLARHFYEFCKNLWPHQIARVAVSETLKTWAYYEETE